MVKWVVNATGEGSERGWGERAGRKGAMSESTPFVCMHLYNIAPLACGLCACTCVCVCVSLVLGMYDR